MTFRGPTCDIARCTRPATHHVGRKWKLCAMHASVARISVTTAAKSAVVAAAPALTRRFPKLVTAAKLFLTARAKYDDLRAQAEPDVEEVEVIEATVIRSERTSS